MENTEKKRSIPGIGHIKMQIKTMTKTIHTIEDNIKEILEKITAINQENRNNSPRGEYQLKLKKLSEIWKEHKTKQNENFAHLEELKKDLVGKRQDTNKERGNMPFMSLEDIEKQFNLLNARLIENTISQKEEKEIAQKMLNLRMAKMKLGGIEGKVKEIRNLEEEIKACKAQISLMSKLINEKSAEMNLIKAELDKLVGDKTKPAEVLKLEAQMAALRNQKQAVLDSRTEKKEEIKKAEEEFEKFEVKFLEQQKLEEKKKAIKSDISKYKEEQEALQNEIAGSDPKIFDSMAFKVQNMKENKTFNIDIALVELLIKYGIKIPTNEKDFEKVLEIIKEKRDNFDKTFKEFNNKIKKKNDELNYKIKLANTKLSELPETNHDILKTGMRYKIFN